MLHVYKDVYPPVVGGIEKHIDVLRRHMPDVRSDVIVCSGSSRTSRHRGSYGEEIKVGELGRLLGVPVAPTFPLHLARQRPDVLHLHMPNPLGELSTALSGRRAPVVVSYHADIVRQAALQPLYRPFLRWWLRRATAVIVGSHRLVETSPFLDGLHDRIEVVPYGIDSQLIARGAAGGAKAAEIRRQFGAPLILAVGRLVYYKGYENLVAAARGLDASLLFVGTGPLEEALKRQALNDDRIHFAGAVSEEDLPAYLRAADIFALPSTSRAESFGIATLEAQALGVPAVISDVGTGTIEAVDPGLTGLVVAPGDIRGLRDALQRLLADPAERARMGRAAAARVERGWTAAHQAARVLEIMGSPYKCSRVGRCRPPLAGTTRLRTLSCARGSPTMRRAWTTWTGCAGRTGFCVRAAAPFVAGVPLMDVGRVAGARAASRRRRARSFTAHARR